MKFIRLLSDYFLPHIRLEHFGDGYAAISLLVVLHQGDENSGQG
jgi:hypothetical protein